MNELTYYFIKEMGNYCCTEEDHLPEAMSPKLRKKVSLNDPSVKKEYEESIGQALNSALNKFKEEKRVENIRLKSRLGKGGQGEVFLA